MSQRLRAVSVFETEVTGGFSVRGRGQFQHVSKRSRAVSGFDDAVTGEIWCAREAVTHEVGVQGKRSRAKFGFRVQGSGFRVQGSGFRVQGSGYKV